MQTALWCILIMSHKHSYDDDDDRTFQLGVSQGWSRNNREEVLEGNRISSRKSNDHLAAIDPKESKRRKTRAANSQY